MEKITYAFIDGGYVRERLDVAMREVFGVPGALAPEAIVSPDVFRVYFYDCIDDAKTSSESEAEFEARLDAQDQNLSRMRSRAGLHIRLGTLSRGRRRSQKEVDVLLAVDMLTHGFNRNMTHAVLVTGDLDFRPVVEALVRGGVFVEVWYEKRSAAKDLPAAADFGFEINWHQLYRWNTDSFLAKYQPPSYSMAHDSVRGILVGSGSYKGRTVEMFKPGSAPFVLRVEQDDGVHWFDHENQQVLERYFSTIYGPIDWQSRKSL